jgi:hypothetical protein
LAGLSCPRKGLVGPWTHAYPHLSAPGPAIGYLQEAVRWWDHWLKGIDTGIMAEPIYRVWMLEPKPPRPWFAEHPGRWVAEATWPSPRITPRAFHLAETGLAEAAPASAHIFQHRSPQIAGTDCGRWGGYGGESPDLPLDQRVEDGCTLCFDSPPLGEDIEILGAPEVELTLASDRPQAHLTARLCDVAPDGTSALVTYAPLNLTHRDSHEHPAALEPGRFYKVRLKLNDIARRISAGHRLRLALATAHWPIVWPAPDNATLSTSTEGSRLILPQRPPRPEDADLLLFESALAPPPIAYRETRPGKSWRRISDDLGENLRRIEMGLDYGAGEILDIGIEDDAVLAETYEISPDDPLSARARIEGKAGFASAGHRCRIETVTELSATRESFEMAAKIEAFEDGKSVFARSYRNSIPREFM